MDSSKSKLKILVENSSWVYFGKISVQLFSFIVTVLVIRQLAVEVFGTYRFLVNTMVVFSVFTVDPIATIFQRYIPELAQVKDNIRLKKMLIMGLAISVVLQFVLFVLIVFFQTEFSKLFNIDNFEQYLLPLVLFIFLTFIKTLVASILRSFLLHKSNVLLNIIHTILRSVFFLYFLSILDVNLILYIEAFLSLLYIIPSIYIVFKSLRVFSFEITEKKSNLVTKIRVIRFGFFASLNELGSGVVGKTSDYFIISAIGSPYYVGLYAFAYNIYNLVYKVLPFQEFESVLRPLFFQKFSNNYNREEFINYYNFIVKVMIPIFTIPAIYFFLFGKEVIEYVYDPKYASAYLVTLIVLISNISKAIFYPLTLTIMLKEKMEIALASKSIFIISIVGGIFAMNYYGIVGVAIMTLIGDLLRNMFMFFAIKGKADVAYLWKEYLNYLYILLILVSVFFFANMLVGNLLSLFLITLVFVVSSFVLFIWFHPFNQFDLVLINRIIAKSRLLLKLKTPVIFIYKLK